MGQGEENNGSNKILKSLIKLAIVIAIVYFSPSIENAWVDLRSTIDTNISNTRMSGNEPSWFLEALLWVLDHLFGILVLVFAGFIDLIRDIVSRAGY